MTETQMKTTMNIFTWVGLIASIAFIIYGIQTKIFFSEDAMYNFLAYFGVWGPIVFVLFQAIQVIFPILPGGIGCVGGVIFFGPVWGFIYNYIGICAGSIGAFMLAQKYGTPFVESIFSPKLYKKYITWTEKDKRFDKMFALAIFLPVAPDDFLCYLAGTTKMTLQRFTTIILLGKPLAIAAYSMGLHLLIQNLFK